LLVAALGVREGAHSLPPFAVLIDAGSSGSRITLYAVRQPVDGTHLPRLEPLSAHATLKVEPGTPP
jgi:hypothetical protein